MRTLDLPVPVPVNAPECDTNGLHVAINVFTTELAPEVDVWDVALWDGTGVTWSSVETWVDITGDVRGLVVDQQANEDNGQLAAASLTFTLDNTSGDYSQLQAGGAEPVLAFGGRIAVWTDDGAGDVRWRFYGRIESWIEGYGEGPNAEVRQGQQEVEVEAFDTLNLLDQSVDGLTYPIGGREGETTTDRLAYLAAVAGMRRGLKPLSVDAVGHRNIESTNPVLDSMQLTAESAGGVVGIDVDGQLAYYSLTTMVAGRPDATQPRLIFSDSCVPGVFTFWNGEPITGPDAIINRVTATNIDAAVVDVRDQPSINRFGTRLLPLDAQTWARRADAEEWAGSVIERRAEAYLRVEPITYYGELPEVRIGDLIRYVRDLAGVRVDVLLRITGLAWSTGPGESAMTYELATAPAVAFVAYSRWDEAGWDDDEWAP